MSWRSLSLRTRNLTAETFSFRLPPSTMPMRYDTVVGYTVIRSRSPQEAAHAALGHPYHFQHLRRCGHERDGTGPLKGCGLGALTVLTDRNGSRRLVTYRRNGSSGRTRTYNPPVNSRMLCH